MAYLFHRKILHPRAVHNDAGFDVEFRGMVSVRYSEPGRSVTFRSEPAIIEHGEFKGQHGWLVTISKPTNWDDGTPLSESERQMVQKRSKDGLKFMGVPHIAG